MVMVQGSQVHEHGDHALAAVGRVAVDRVVEVVKVRLVLLAVLVVQHLDALLVLCSAQQQARHGTAHVCCARKTPPWLPPPMRRPQAHSLHGDACLGMT